MESGAGKAGRCVSERAVGAAQWKALRFFLNPNARAAQRVNIDQNVWEYGII